MENQKAYKQQWWQRRALYSVATVVLIVLAALGVINESQMDSLLTQIVAIGGPIIGFLGTGLAATKTKPGSDDPTTLTQLHDSAAEAARAASDQAQETAERIAESVTNAVRDVLGGDLGDIAGLPDKVVQAIRQEERGEYPEGTPAQVAEPVDYSTGVGSDAYGLGGKG